MQMFIVYQALKKNIKTCLGPFEALYNQLTKMNSWVKEVRKRLITEFLNTLDFWWHFICGQSVSL